MNVYKEVLSALLGDVLQCKQQARNWENHTVAVLKDSLTVGHIPCNMFCICSCDEVAQLCVQ